LPLWLLYKRSAEPPAPSTFGPPPSPPSPAAPAPAPEVPDSGDDNAVRFK
jgi:hypothetical protein